MKTFILAIGLFLASGLGFLALLGLLSTGRGHEAFASNATRGASPWRLEAPRFGGL